MANEIEIGTDNGVVLMRLPGLAAVLQVEPGQLPTFTFNPPDALNLAQLLLQSATLALQAGHVLAAPEPSEHSYVGSGEADFPAPGSVPPMGGWQ